MDDPSQGQPPPQPYQPPQQPYTPQQPPYQPPPQQYQPQQPPAAYPPPQAYPPQPLQQPAGYPPQGYAPPPPPAAKRKGFNWLACCGITCLVLLIVGGGIGFCTWRMVQPFINMGMEISKVQETVQAADMATIASGGVTISAEQLYANPLAYQGQWLILEGKIGNQSDMNASFSTQNFDTSEMTPYFVEGGVLVFDITKAPPVGGLGDSIRAYGQIYVFDLEVLGKMPLVGPMIVEELKKDPSLKGMTKMVFFLAKQVERTAPGDDSATMPEDWNSGADSAGSDGSSSGWIR